MASNKEFLLGKLRTGQPMSTREQLKITFILAIPAILAQLSMCLMSYIDAAMVGRLGSAQAASIGLVSSCTWILGSFCYANSSGFSVQIAHRCGAGDLAGARKIFFQGLKDTLAASLLLVIAGVAISSPLPVWLGGSEEINADAFSYFLLYSLFLPTFQLAIYCEASLIASGNLKITSIMNVMMCVLDAGFNYLFIFVLDLGVKGAAIGTGLATTCVGIFLLVYATRFSRELKLSKAKTEEMPVSYESKAVLKNALGISWPLWIQNLAVRGAYIAATIIIAPLGTIAIAANAFAIIAEGFCYLPGFGMQDAATTLVGQSLGAGRKTLAKRFAFITIASGASMMFALAVLMWIFAPQIMAMLSNDPEVVALGAKCLRIEAWAELFFGIGIVANGCCVGAGDTLMPSAINLISMWVVRIGLALLLIPRYGLEGYWYAMAIELSVKGIIFALRISGDKWTNKVLTGAGAN